MQAASVAQQYSDNVLSIRNTWGKITFPGRFDESERQRLARLLIIELVMGWEGMLQLLTNLGLRAELKMPSRFYFAEAVEQPSQTFRLPEAELELFDSNKRATPFKLSESDIGNIVILVYGARCVFAHGSSAKTWDNGGALGLFTQSLSDVDKRDWYKYYFEALYTELERNDKAALISDILMENIFEVLLAISVAWRDAVSTLTPTTTTQNLV